MTALDAVKQITERLENVRLPEREAEAFYTIRECIDLLYAVGEVIEKAQITEPQDPDPEEVNEDV